VRIAVCCMNADIIGGVPKLAALLASSLKRNGFDVACVSLKRPIEGKSFTEFFEIDRWYTPKLAIPETLPMYIGTLIYQNYFLSADQLKKCEKEFKPDIVINMLAWGGAEVLRKVKARKILYVHFPTDLHLSSRWWWWRLHAPCLKEHYHTLKRVSKVICNSNYIKKFAYDSWGRYLPLDRFGVIYPCVDWDRYQRNGSEHRPRRVCYVGRISYDKGIELVVDAFLKANVKESELVIAGAFLPHYEYNMRLREKLLRLRERRIRLIENPSDEEIIKIYKSSMVFANFNPLETFGICVVEAMASGAPPIVADGGAQRETVINGCTGFRVSAESSDISDEMAKYMRLLLTDEDVFKTMSMRARLHAKQFDESEFTRKWIEILEAN
jgi:glycosyltransferase involved in cell wall biosynthesis